ncbi:MAG: four helix bundle protein [Elusimicrobia bacterium]|nr:four helix bundle protein [Elusimicrobiota bacterium]
MEIFKTCGKFPKEEIYSLTNQLVRSSRTIPANIAEGWAKRRYENVFIKHLTDAIGSCEETKVWLDFAKDCKYLTKEEYSKLLSNCDEIGTMLFSLANNWKKF